MANSYFQFKQFLIHQDNCGMKVSTDAVVLGALAIHDKCRKILDIGTGTGVVALMLAQRFPLARIHAVEIDKAAFDQAADNFSNSPWEQRISLYHQSFQDFAKKSEQQFDFIVTNPPYFSAHLRSESPQRNLALHNDELSFGNLLAGVTQLLTSNGKFWVILPERQMQDLRKLALIVGLHPQESIELRDRPQARILRIITAFSFQEADHKTKPLYIRDENRDFSIGYKDLLAQFLLAF